MAVWPSFHQLLISTLMARKLTRSSTKDGYGTDNEKVYDLINLTYTTKILETAKSSPPKHTLYDFLVRRPEILNAATCLSLP